MQVVVIGGGIAGLISSILLARRGLEVALIERKKYPFHRVCGEYISNEAARFLKSLNAYPYEYNPPLIDKLILSSVNGRSSTNNLDLGGFGISRFSFDHFLSKIAIDAGVKLMLGTVVEDVKFENDEFTISLNEGKVINSPIAVGAFGKRSVLDRKLNRKFISKISPYIGVKYHIRYEVPSNQIALHNFQGGYCGISNVENNIVNLCYLSERKNLKQAGSIQQMEQDILKKNPFLCHIWDNAEFMFKDPVVINEINFDSKGPVDSHVLMTGDSAGMITPLCGNGMAMAIHSAKIVSEEIDHYFNSASYNRQQLETVYSERWSKEFSLRLRTGRLLQKLFGRTLVSNLSVAVLKNSESISNYLISKTHGKEF